MGRTIGVMARVFDQPDGLGLYCRNLLRHMVALDFSTRYVMFLRSAERIADFLEFPNVGYSVLTAPGGLCWDQFAVPVAARRHGVDLIFSPKLSLPLLTTRPCAFVLQDPDWYWEPRSKSRRRGIYLHTMLPLYCRKARRLLVISHFARDNLVRNRLVSWEKTSVAYGAVGTNFTGRRNDAQLAAFRTTHRLPAAFILTVLNPHQGHAIRPRAAVGSLERLLLAFQSYRGAGGRLHLVIVGHGAEDREALHGCNGSLSSGVCLLGPVPNDQMHLPYQLAEFYVSAGLGGLLPILEALACGCPAVVPRTCAVPEVAERAARFVNPYDERELTAAMLELDRSPALRHRLRVAGLVRAEAFGWSRVARRVLTALEDLPVRACIS
ncbi:MAG TPA: glycosyltransferase family 1 protein [Steroidobacteraceae bacterium]|jgi:glycosyltransferase involved in cell wall biosynthesis